MRSREAYDIYSKKLNPTKKEQEITAILYYVYIKSLYELSPELYQQDASLQNEIFVKS